VSRFGEEVHLVAEQPRWLEARGLTKTYGGVRALDDASLALRPGEIRGLVGANGAGKSTLVKVLTGLVVPDAGEVLVDGTPLHLGHAKKSLQAGIASVPQELTVASSMTVAENVMLGHEPRGRFGRLRGRELRRRARDVLDSLSLDVDVDDRVGTLRLIEQRLMMVARALSYDARLVIFDEPTATVAPVEVGLVLGTIEALRQRGVAVLYVSHRLDEIERICDSVTILRDGRVAAERERSPTHAELVKLLAPEHEALETGARRRPEIGSQTVLAVRGLSGERLRDVDLVAHAGEIVGLAGVAGSGARELVLTLVGAVPYEEGSVAIDGSRVAPGSPLRAVNAGMGFLPGDRALAVFANHSVRHNVSLSSLARYTFGPFVDVSDERALVSTLLERVHLRADQTAPISSFSGGNQQRAIVARWMASNARVLLLDDPTAGVDVATRPEIHRQILDLCAAGAAVVLVSTDVDELAELSDRCVIFDRGAVVAELAGAKLTPARLLAAMTRTAA
jgi:ABC-type sugar transport system ATPase subunit